uniref:Uncharacterized protein n=1 Tax=Klebsormidium flaccidum TaxID=3175 RepID=A0A0B5H507_KLEFL|nr:hypothetical protein [Klebsormidium flaccidum]
MNLGAEPLSTPTGSAVVNGFSLPVGDWSKEKKKLFFSAEQKTIASLTKCGDRNPLRVFLAKPHPKCITKPWASAQGAKSHSPSGSGAKSHEWGCCPLLR